MARSTRLLVLYTLRVEKNFLLHFEYKKSRRNAIVDGLRYEIPVTLNKG